LVAAPDDIQRLANGARHVWATFAAFSLYLSAAVWFTDAAFAHWTAHRAGAAYTLPRLPAAASAALTASSPPPRACAAPASRSFLLRHFCIPNV